MHHGPISIGIDPARKEPDAPVLTTRNQIGLHHIAIGVRRFGAAAFDTSQDANPVQPVRAPISHAEYRRRRKSQRTQKLARRRNRVA